MEEENAALVLDFPAFFRGEFTRIARDAYFVVGSKELAADIAQDAFIKAYVRWKKVSGYEKPGAWVRRVAIRLAIKVRERRAREVDLESASELSTSFDHEQHADLREAIKQLSANQRAAIVLHYYYDYPLEEVAELMGCRPSTARVHLHRGRDRLRELLVQESAF